MRKLFLLFAPLLCLLLPTNNYAHPSDALGSISGTVVENELHQPVAYAAVVVKSGDGTRTITGGITGEDGKFEIDKLEDGTYFLEIQYIGYRTHTQKLTIAKEDRTVELGTIALVEETRQLEGVEVVGERTTIEQKVDRKVINVGKDLTTAGATASEIMNNIPSVNVDAQTGELTLRGNANVRVMVDGKLSNVPVAQLLKQIPSTSIKSIELITNPSAKYNPEGMSGIINIVLHKNANIGFNGSIDLGLTLAEEAKFNSTVDMNYRHGKFNFYGNYGNNIGKWLNDGQILRVVEGTRQDFDIFNNNKSHLYKLGVDFYLNDKNTLSIFTNQNIFDGRGDFVTWIYNPNDPSRDVTQYYDDVSENQSQQYNFDYKLEFAREGHNIELEVDHNRYDSGQDSDFSSLGNTIYPDYRDQVDTDRRQTTANLDYVNPLDSISKLELGLESRNFETQVDYASTGLSFDSNGDLVPTPSTEFVYAMDIYSAYATFGQSYARWSYQLGVRIEDVKVQVDTNAVGAFTHDYTELYPSAFLTYSPNEKDQLQLSYSRRVDRPGLGQVNPIREFSTPLVSAYGNPDLLPQFTNSFELNYTKRLEQGSITTGLFYRRISDEINQTLTIDRLDLNRTILTHENFDNTSSYGLEISGNYKPLTWWNINGSFDIFSQTQRGLTEYFDPQIADPGVEDILTENIEVDNTAWNLRMNNNFTVTKKLSLQAFGFYRGKFKSIQFESDPMYFVNVGARYSFDQGRGTLSVNYSDVFRTMEARFTSEYPYAMRGEFHWESNKVYVGLSYRFGSGKYRAKQRKQRDDNIKQEGGGIL